MKVLCFYLGGQEYATDITQVREVLDPSPVTFIPHTPSFIRGVINLRGNIIAVMDLRRFFDLPEADHGRGGGKIMILSIRGTTLGALADRISQVRTLEPGQMDPPPATLGQVDSEYFQGVKQMGDHPLIFLDLSRVLDSPHLSALRE